MMRLSLSCTLILLSALASWVNADEVKILDPNLEATLRALPIIPDTGAIMSEDLSKIQSLLGVSKGIEDLTGLEHCVNLWYLNLTGNHISDVSPLAGLTKLSYLHLISNNISNISPLAGLADLYMLCLNFNSIGDISSLAELTNLEYLYIRYNPLSYEAITEDIPILADRGVHVYFTNRIPKTLQKSSGDGQTGATKTALPGPLVVQVLDQEDDPFEAVPVTFAVTVGGGSLISVDSATDADGLARATLILGTTPGLNTVEVTAAGITASVTFEATAELQNIPPYAIIAAPQEGMVGEELYFDGSSSFDFDGNIVSYEWDFSAGTNIESVRSVAMESGISVSHVYYTPGIYIVTLTVVDNYGDEGSGTAEVIIKTLSEVTDDLMVCIEDLDLPEGLENSLKAPLQSAVDALDRENYKAAEGKLNAFINSVMAQAGKKLSIDQAEDLIGTVEWIISGIETR